MVVFRFRNKTVVSKLPIEDIISDRSLINGMHPYDSYQVGMIYAMHVHHVFCSTNCVGATNSVNSNYAINPYIEYMGIDLLTNALLFKPKFSQNTIKIPIGEFYSKTYLLLAISSDSAFSIGYSMAEYFIDYAAI